MPDINRITAVIITKNEERNIGRCLDSLIGVADEIVVIDSFSDDVTAEICKNYQLRFIQKEWLGYAETKNFGISLANNPFILSLDADEALSEELRNEILILKDNEISSDGFYLNRLTNYCGKWIYHCGWYPDFKIRLWRKEAGLWEGIIHEEVKLLPAARTGKLKGNILHYSYYSVNEHIEQMIRFTDLMAEDLFQKGKKVTIFRVVLSPLVKFLKSYLLRGGFRDGFYGLVICCLSGMASFLKYAKVYQKYRRI
jgi:glycosyltransferase involved in cell wall biosynthesis